eukprot:8275208-Pyramimonas_sp.AAC.1
MHWAVSDVMPWRGVSHTKPCFAVQRASVCCSSRCRAMMTCGTTICVFMRRLQSCYAVRGCSV